MKFEKINSDIPNCCRLNFDVGELNFRRHSDNPAVIRSICPQANFLEKRLKNDPNTDVIKSDLISGSWEAVELFDAWPEVRNLLNRFPHSKYAKAQLRQIPPLGRYPVHRDGISDDDEKKGQFDLFNRSIRIHIPVQTNPDSYIYSVGKFYRMREGECWMLNNFQKHTAMNLSATEFRVHLILDVEPNPETMALIKHADTDLGIENAALLKKLNQKPITSKLQKLWRAMSRITAG